MSKYQLLPPLARHQQETLEADILLRGIKNPVEVDEDGNILDGHSRTAIASRHGIPCPRVTVSDLPTEAHKRAYVYRVNRARRQLTLEQEGDLYPDMRQTARELAGYEHTQTEVGHLLGVSQQTVSSWLSQDDATNTSAGNSCVPDQRVSVEQSCYRDISERITDGATQEEVASEYGVSRQAIAKIAKKITEACDALAGHDDLLGQYLDGEKPLKTLERIVRDRKASAEREERFARESGVIDTPEPVLRSGDFREVLADVRDVGLVLTDPPYPREFLPLWSDLGAWAARALRPGHLLVAYSGQYHLPEVIQRLSEHLDYVWLGWIETTGPQNQPRQRPVISSGKPLLFFSNGPLSETTRKRKFRDVVAGTGYTRDLMETGGGTQWAQDEEPAAFYITALTEAGETVADPFLGSGTFGRAAVALKRRLVGAELDAAVFEQAKSRIAL